MKMLHILNQSSQHTQQLERVIKYATPGDRLLFIGDAVDVVGLTDPEPMHAIQDFALFALEEDLCMRGLKNVIPEWLNVITDAQWVKLTMECNNIISWD